MGFAWHKLIPRHPSVPSVCPPPCIDVDGWVESIDSVCAPERPNGTQPCAVFNPVSYPTGGLQCGGEPVLGGGQRNNPGGPLELRLNVPLNCTAPNAADIHNSLSMAQRCEMGAASVTRQFYYYRTPNSPSSLPTQIASEKICLKFNPFSIPDRLMVISGRNRYKYGGWHVDPSCAAAGEEGGPPNIWDVVDVGGTGIKQAETLSLGRPWPLPNSVLNLPLFGANESVNPSVPPTPCGSGACTDPSCFSVRSNTGTGHYGRSDQGNGKGYYSFQCFNPMGFVGDNSLPTCSVWSLVQALWYQAWSPYGNEISGRTAYPNTWTAFSNLLAANPSESTSDKSNVAHHLDLFANALASFVDAPGITTALPNVFLWDKDAYVAASTNEDKWKHIYIVGNANVIFDTQCMLGSGSAGSSDRYGFVIHLDEVAHDPTFGSTGNARLLGFFGCNPSNASNANSSAYFELTTMNCVPSYNPKKGVYSTYCDECANEGVDLVENECYHQGYSPNCNFTWPTGWY